MFAVIKSGGRQYKVSVGQRLEVNRLPVEVGKQVQFNEVLLISDATTTMVGAPLVEDALVLATAIEHARGEKLIVFKYKPKKRQRHRRGHRQELTVFTIDDIIAGGKSLLTGEAPTFREEEEEDVVEAEPTTVETPEAESEAKPETVTETAASEEAEAETEKKPTRRRRARKAEETEGEGEK
ncbi:MAG TPA: 50S ribosomal protein L21 [Ktedonobacteraceae bacterium]|nr:50S ribosomal protein L21 [Ktedonobacteraceae bacterium]